MPFEPIETAFGNPSLGAGSTADIAIEGPGIVPHTEVWPFSDLDDGQQMIRRAIVYTPPPEDASGFFSPTHEFGTANKVSTYDVPSTIMTDVEDGGRKVYDADEYVSGMPEGTGGHDTNLGHEWYTADGTLTDTFTLTDWGEMWEYGEEPIYYVDSELVSISQHDDWPTIHNYILDVHPDLPHTSYYIEEYYLDWYNYTEADLNYGFEWKNDWGEWRQMSQLRNLPKIKRNAGLSPDIISTDGWATSYMPQEAPHIMPRLGDKYGPLIEVGVEGYMMIRPGYAHHSELFSPEWLPPALRKRFKSKSMAYGACQTYLNNVISYVANTGYTTILRRALTSNAQKVNKFRNSEFTTMAGGSLIFSNAALGALESGTSLGPTTGDFDVSTPGYPLPTPGSPAPLDTPVGTVYTTVPGLYVPTEEGG